MKAELAKDLLIKVMGWEPEEYVSEKGHIQAMANYKYDTYEEFSPGMKFIESLALWLDQFNEADERKIAYELVKKNLIFISKNEIEHFIQTIYDDIIKPIIFQKTAELKGIPDYKIKNISESKEYHYLKRKCLFLGLSDGAHLDYFRRVHELNNEQVYLTYQIDDEKAKDMKEKLKDDLFYEESDDEEDNCTFDLVFLLDDFSGSGDSILRKETKVKFNEIPSNLKQEIDEYEWGGKLWIKEKEKELVFKGEMDEKDFDKLIVKSSEISYKKIIQKLYKESTNNDDNIQGKLNKILDKLRDFQLQKNPLISKQVEVIIILYISTQFAIETLKECIEKYKQDWWPNIKIITVQTIYNEDKISNLNNKFINKLLIDYYDQSIMDDHLKKGGCDVVHGYNNCSLPLVIHHNTPNNSIYILWAKTDKNHPLFKRVSRHKVE